MENSFKHSQYFIVYNYSFISNRRIENCYYRKCKQSSQGLHVNTVELGYNEHYGPAKYVHYSYETL